MYIEVLRKDSTRDEGYEEEGRAGKVQTGGALALAA